MFHEIDLSCQYPSSLKLIFIIWLIQLTYYRLSEVCSECDKLYAGKLTVITILMNCLPQCVNELKINTFLQNMQYIHRYSDSNAIVSIPKCNACNSQHNTPKNLMEHSIHTPPKGWKTPDPTNGMDISVSVYWRNVHTFYIQ